MARRRKSSQTSEEKVSQGTGGLKKAYSGKVGGNKYVVYAHMKKPDEEHPRVLVLTFNAEYAARRLIDILIGNDEWEWGPDIGSRKCLVTSSGMKISMFGNHLPELSEYQMTAAEAEWRDPMMEQAAMRLRLGTTWEAEKKNDDYVEETIEDAETGQTKVVKTKKQKVKKEPKQKIDKTGSITAQDLAAKLNVEARVFRGALRALGLPKPAGGWHWPAEEAKDIEKKVEKKLKEQGKKK